jgi:phosphatidylinositol alpha-1,6-mannosyltransferase
MHEKRKRGRPRLLLIGPYFRPSHYGGVVQIYHQLLTRLQFFDGVIVSQRLGADPGETSRFDQDCPVQYGYHVTRVERFDLKFPASATLVERLVDSARFFFQTRAEWAGILRTVQPDVVVCGATLTAGWLMSRIPKSMPFINYLHGEELATEGESRFIRPYLFAKQMEAIRNADLNLSVSRYTANRAAELAGIERERIVLLPNFVDVSRFLPPLDREAARRQLGWQDKRIILSLARLTPRKGIDQAVRALAELRRVGKLSPDWLHIIAGLGEQEAELRRLVDQLGFNGYTRFEGFVEQERLPLYYGAADIFLQPNRDLAGDTEGFGVVFLEANACGTPVIGGVAGGTADAIREGITGFRVDSEDLSAIGRAILQLTENEGLRRRMGKTGFEVVRREHRLESGVAKFEELVSRVTKQRGIQDSRSSLGE